MLEFFRKTRKGPADKLANLQEVHSGENFKILKANKKIPLDVLKGEVKDFTTEQIKKILKDNRSMLQKHTTYYKSGNFILALVPVKDEKEFRMELIDEKNFFFKKGATILSSTTDC
jgi:hypothetical protein